MYNNYDYPLGADTPDAPWNQSDPEPVSKDIEYSCTMRRTAVVETTNYVPGTWEKDEDGFGFRDGDDFSDTDWLGEFKKNTARLSNSLNYCAKQQRNLQIGTFQKNAPAFGVPSLRNAMDGN